VIDANFAPSQFVPEVVSVWLSYWALVPQTPALRRVHAINEKRMISNFRHALKPHLPEDKVKAVATGLAALIEGLWLRCALSTAGVTPEEAAGIARDYATGQFKKHAAANQPPARQDKIKSAI
jgi:TetR/AcrR family transcriptional repressor of bet genes